MTSDSATCARSPLLPVEQPSIRGEDDCDDARSISSWKNIFAVAPAAGAPPPALGVNFMKATQHTITVEFTLATVHGTPWKDSHGEGRAILTLGQDLLQRGLGAVVWDCGEHLAAFLGHHRHLVAGKKVLDLGTGTGIAGLAAAQCGTRNTTLTDHAALGPLVRSNVERNALALAATACLRPIFVPFSWDDHTPEEALELAPPDDPFDLVLASDCLYDSTMFAAFRKALAATCGPRTIILMAYKRRLDSRERDFFAQLEDDFDLEVVDPRRHRPLAASNDDFEASVPGGTTSAAGRNCDVYLLLGVLRGYQHAEDRSSPLDKWRVYNGD